MILVALASGLTAGLVALPHCTLMCGPLCAYACREQGSLAPVRYQLGRTVSYVGLGIAAGVVGGGAAALAGTWAPAILSWLLAGALVVTAVGLWRGTRAPRATANSPVALTRRRAGLFRRARDRALLVGLASALLPCGALGLAVVMAAATGHPLHGALVMLGFVTTSGVGVGVAGALASRARRITGRRSRRALAFALLAGAAILIARPIGALSGGQSSPSDCPLHPAHSSSSEPGVPDVHSS